MFFTDIDFVKSATIKPYLTNEIKAKATYHLLKNALEAFNKGRAVSIGRICMDDKLKYRVHNHVLIPREVDYKIKSEKGHTFIVAEFVSQNKL